jgi:hypothetical protein
MEYIVYDLPINRHQFNVMLVVPKLQIELTIFKP